MTIIQLNSFINKIHRKEQVTDTQVINFIKHMYKKENPGQPCNIETIKKLYSIPQFLQVVLKKYIELIEENPREYGLFYTRIWDKNNTLIYRHIRVL